MWQNWTAGGLLLLLQLSVKLLALFLDGIVTHPATISRPDCLLKTGQGEELPWVSRHAAEARRLGRESKKTERRFHHRQRSIRNLWEAVVSGHQVIRFKGELGKQWRYWPDRPLGPAGGFGCVFEAETDNGQPMAVKVVHKNRPEAQLDDRLLRREVDIGRKVAEVTDSLLLPVVDVAETGDALLLVMERAERCLREVVGKVTEAEVVSILKDLVVGLGQLHGVGVIHRDLKPANVLWHAHHWKLADFGIARDTELGTQSPTFVGWGSLQYMAPELWQLKSPTVKTDLYALGCVAFELLAGAPPFSGDEATLRNGHLTQTVPAVPCANVALRNLVSRLLAKDPGDRPQDARAVGERLARLAMVLTPEQEAIARELATHAEERSQQAAAEARRAAELEALGQKRSQAKADLRELIEDALEQVQQVDPDARYSQKEGYLLLENRDATVQFILWDDIPDHPLVEGDTMVLAGGVRIRNRRFPSLGLLVANIVYEETGGRLEWRLYQFRMAFAQSYDYGPRDRAHGLDKPSFLDRQQRYVMLHPAIHVWSLTKSGLTVEAILKLFNEALALRPPAS